MAASKNQRSGPKQKPKVKLCRQGHELTAVWYATRGRRTMRHLCDRPETESEFQRRHDLGRLFNAVNVGNATARVLRISVKPDRVEDPRHGPAGLHAAQAKAALADNVHSLEALLAEAEGLVWFLKGGR